MKTKCVGIVIDDICYVQDGAPMTYALRVQGGCKADRYGMSPAMQWFHYGVKRVFDDEVPRPDLEFCKKRAKYCDFYVSGWASTAWRLLAERLKPS